MSEKFFECVVDLKEQTGFIDGQTSACLYSKPKPETGSNVDKEKVKKKRNLIGVARAMSPKICSYNNYCPRRRRSLQTKASKPQRCILFETLTALDGEPNYLHSLRLLS